MRYNIHNPRHYLFKFSSCSYKICCQVVPKKLSDCWDIQPISDDGSIPNDIVAKIIGSRRSILFIEGDSGSLDLSLYRKIYNDYTVIPVGSCEQVIHTVASFISRQDLHHVGSAGIIDADGRTSEEKAALEKEGVYCLPVSEVENIFLLPRVFLAVAKEYKFNESEASAKLCSLKTVVFEHAERQLEHICLRYVKRRIDSKIKKIGLGSVDIASLSTEYVEATSTIVPLEIFENIKSKINKAIFQREYEEVLLYYDNKGLLSEVARSFGLRQRVFEEFIGRLLQMDPPSELLAAIMSYLPAVRPYPHS